MGRYEKSARNSLKSSTSLSGSIIDIIRHDLRKQEVRIEEELRSRLEDVQDTLVEIASIQDAIIAGSIEVRKELEKASKKHTRHPDRESMIVTIIDTATRLGELKKLHNDAIARLQGVLSRPPNAVESVERLSKDLLKLSGSWESAAREIDESMVEVVDQNLPIELVKLQRELDRGGYDLILAGNDRNQENIESARAKIRELTDDLSDSSE
ncbi:MAG: hypothetical protein QGI21_00520 [Candidatus Poseidoniaceae archaeon]|jgi:hypothetical protein|nr:hypothetical protein [Candidatus Poseidoniaceae archaeon]